MNDLKNNEIRITVTAMLNGDQYDSVDVFPEYGNDIPQDGRCEEVAAVMSAAIAMALRGMGAHFFDAITIIGTAINAAYAEEDTKA